VLYRPSRPASAGPLTGVRPLDPSTFAATIRGEAPRRRTSIPSKRPRTSPRSFAAALAKLSVSFHVWRGPRSYWSTTLRSHGCGCEPMNEFSTSSVRPPELAKKYVIAGSPA